VNSLFHFPEPVTVLNVFEPGGAKMASEKKDGGITRRQVVVGGVAAALSAGALGAATAKERGPEDGKIMSSNSSRMPAVYVPHGGGPWPFVDLGFPQAELDSLAAYLRGVAKVPAQKPRALLVISAHWEESRPTVMTSEKPAMLYDYYGFPPESYTLQWPAPGEPRLAQKVRDLLSKGGFETGEDADRGFDHGTFVPLMLTYPEAEIPTTQLSLKRGLDPQEHLAMGRALAPLRDEGVFIIGSGMSYHNMRAFMNPAANGEAEDFDRWLQEVCQADPADRDAALAQWAKAPSARACHPREEHLLPLMVVAGAAGADRGKIGFSGPILRKQCSAIHFG
jgi:aromatic ring-opening dioxygenase catalytic subunit (LigB family)